MPTGSSRARRSVAARLRAPGFAIILILRYVLETCRNVAEGAEALGRIPVALSQNVTLLDASGAYATMFLGPDRAPALSQVPVCTNHQEVGAAIGQEQSTRTIERQQSALQSLEDPEMTLENLSASFLVPPFYSRSRSSPTVYSAVYRPGERRVD